MNACLCMQAKRRKIDQKYSLYCVSLLMRDKLTFKLHENEKNIYKISHNLNGMILFGVVIPHYFFIYKKKWITGQTIQSSIQNDIFSIFSSSLSFTCIIIFLFYKWINVKSPILHNHFDKIINTDKTITITRNNQI